MGEDAGAVVGREALEIDGNVYALIAHQLGDVPVAGLAHVDQAIEAGLQATAHRARVVGPIGEADNLEPGAVVALE